MPQWTIKMRRDSARNWTLTNPILSDGEPGFETETRRIKVGDGVTRWKNLAYVGSESSGSIGAELLASHVNAPEPHPIYDDGPSLVLLYQNAKV